jgi:hypothetical protein
MFGGRLVGAFANQTIFNFVGNNPKQPQVQSQLPLSFVQPFLRGGGRAVTLEPLTLAERSLVYQVRNFARFRQELIPYFLTATGGGGGTAFAPTATIDNAGNTFESNQGYLSVIQQLQTVENDRRTLSAFDQILRVYQELSKGAASGISQLQVDQIDQNVQTSRQTLIGDELSYRNQLDGFKIQLGIPPDVPIVLDRSILYPFRDVFDEIDRWAAREDRDPEELLAIIDKLPKLDDVAIDGRSVLAYIVLGRQISDVEDLIGDIEAAYAAVTQAQGAAATGPPPTQAVRKLAARRPELNALRQRVEVMKREQGGLIETVNLAAERVALENRLDLMNSRAQLYDFWRQLAVTANALRGVFNLTLTNQVFTPPTTSNPFAFVDQAKQFSLVMNAELPLVRLNERNNFQIARINYRRAQRNLMSQEDNVKLQVRTEVRGLIQSAEIYEIIKRNLFLNLRQKDNTLQQIVAPPAAGGDAGAGAAGNQTAQTTALISAQNGILRLQNQLIATWVSYVTGRITIFRDLGTIPYDEWEAYYELFPSAKPGAGAGGGPRADAGPARPPAAVAPGAGAR